MNTEICFKLIKDAYRKLKNYAYYDKTQFVLKYQIVEFEKDNQDIDSKLDELFQTITKSDELSKLKSDLLDKISFYSLPKNITKSHVHGSSTDLSYKNQSNDTTNRRIIKICSKGNYNCDVRHFIKLPIEGHILSVLWIMLIGCKIDSKISENSFGNRLQTDCAEFEKSDIKHCKFLFKRYFDQYSIWECKALENARKEIDNNHDVFIISLDISDYYNSVNLGKKYIDGLFTKAIDGMYDPILEALNDFIYEVIDTYSIKLNVNKCRKILPVGFLPSNIIANYYLSGFDQAVNDLIHPVYYGRYVDDILIVDKVESNASILNNDYHNFENYILQHYLYPVICCNEHDQYYIRNDFLPDNAVTLKLNDKKFKLFHLESQNDVYFDKIKSFLLFNSSEFRFLIDDELSIINDFEKVYSFSVKDASRHFGSIDDIFINKYELSKLLAKYSITCTLINDQNIGNFEKQLSKILTHGVILENFLFWDRIVEILVINSRFSYLLNFCNSVKNAVKTLCCDQSAETATLRQSLLFCLYVALCRNYPLVWSKDRYETQEKIYNDIINCNDFDILNRKVYDINDVVLYFAKSHMIDKSVMVFVFNMFDIKELKRHLVGYTVGINLTKFSDAKSYLKKYWSYTDYCYYPFVIPDYVYSIYRFVKKMECLGSIKECKIYFDEINDGIDINLFDYDNLNPIKYRENDGMSYDDFVINREFKTKILSNNLKLAYINVKSSEKKEKFKIALANIVVDKNSLELIIKGNPNRSHTKYHKLSKIVNLALEQHSDFLILPESCVPLEWLPYLSRISARNDLAIITGVEYIVSGQYVCNATAVILPYDICGYSTARIFFHVKNHYAPAEIEEIHGFGLHPIPGSGKYELFKWKDCYFSVYCCFELSSITDRSLFESYLDVLFAIECNRDVNYYDHIVSSLSRDIHCYCVQVNTADYGDSRITKPAKTEEMNLIKVKGGINPIVIVDFVNISDLRNFQLLQYNLQKQSSKGFKPTPPNFNRDVVLKKIKGEDLLSYFDDITNGKNHGN